jgi:NAD(P)H-dependent FMN reductase
MKLALIYGTASPAGRLAAALKCFKAAAESDKRASVSEIDLSAAPLDWADGRPYDKLSASSKHAIDDVAASAGTIIFTPVYRATAPGVLKNLFDLTPVEALEGKPVGVVSMGATSHHFLGVDADLHPILAWFGAVMVPPGVYLTSASFEAGAPTKGAADELGGYARTMIDFTARLSGVRLEPRPLAARARG